MAMAHAAGALDAELEAGGGAFKKFLAPSSDIYSLAMHKKVAQQGDDALRRYQVRASERACARACVRYSVVLESERARAFVVLCR